MLVPVNNVVKLGMPFASTYFDTNKRKYVEGKYCGRNLPIMDYLSCGIENPYNISTVVGKISEKGRYVVSYGNRLLVVLQKKSLKNVSNVRVYKDGRLVCNDGKLDDLSDMFPDKGIRFIRSMSLMENSSDGLAEKFLASYNGRLCIAKFCKRSNLELKYEKLYYDIGVLTGIPVCKCILSAYSGRACSLSFLEYSPNSDSFTSLKSLGVRVSDIYGKLSNTNRKVLDGQLLLDYLMSQQDRHLGNIALCNGDVYPMYDNGECLGLGTIGYFSETYRKYIEGCDRRYLRSLLNTGNVSARFRGFDNEYSIFRENWRRLWKEM